MLFEDYTNAKRQETMDSNELLELIKKRHSCRNYSDKKVEQEKIDQVIQAGIDAPTGMNRQETIFLAITDEKMIEKLSRLNASIMGRPGDPFYGAKAVIVVLAKKQARTYVYDGAIASAYMLLEAEALSLGACWIHRAKESFMTLEGQEILKAAGINEDVEGIANIILGYEGGEANIHSKSSEGRIFKI